MPTRILFFLLAVAASVGDAQWMRTSLDSIDVTCFATSGTSLFVGASADIRYPNRGVFLSTDSGASWNGAGLTEFGVSSLAVNGSNLFAGTVGGRVFHSTNNGTTWNSVNWITSDRATVSALALSNTNLFAGIDYGTSIPLDSTMYGVWLSTNNGTNWTAANAGLAWEHVLVLAVRGINLFAGTEGAGVFLSTNNGTNWSARNSGLPTYSNVHALAVSGTNLFAGTNISGVYRSTNNGTNWTPVNSGLTNAGVLTLAISGTNLFAGTWRGGGVFLSTNNGGNWSPVNSGLTDTVVHALVVSGTNLFAGTSYSEIVGGSRRTGVWRRSLSEMITSVEPTTGEFPRELALEQNYPNPFNPSTTISYQLPTQSPATLAVFDVLGREVATLVNEVKQPGTYTVQWDATGVASGVYFYRLQAGQFSAVQKVLLVR